MERKKPRNKLLGKNSPRKSQEKETSGERKRFSLKLDNLMLDILKLVY